MRNRTFSSRFGLACWLCVLTALVAYAVLGGAPDARAGWPPDESQGAVDYSDASNWPSDPGYQGMWELWSFLPEVVARKPGVSDQNKRLGSGNHADRAWARTTGDRRILITVLDSGAEWENDDLVNKWFLNAGELPEPDAGCPKSNLFNPRDANGDAIFNVQDYTSAKGHATPTFDTVCDTRVKAKGDVNGNAILDPQDLIATFSDGKDDDSNGYTDDISGWDFFHNDNDPNDDNRFGHGNGEARDSASEGNNGRGDIGTCPDCAVMALRAGDSFVTDANMFAFAVTYAVDIGASVVQEALGTIDNTPFSQQAMDYAYHNDVAIIASAADEDSFHHNFPGTNNHTFYVHAITYDSEGSWKNARTFLNYNNCTNYGAQLLASVPGTGCSSEATGKLSGIAGLVYAAALKANITAPGMTARAGDPMRNRRLTAEEVFQILKTTVDDLNDPADAADPLRYYTHAGWEQRFGYGRINARSAVDAVLDGKLPPEVEIRDPRWFQVLHPERAGKVTINGRIALGHAAPGETVSWILEYARGVDPDNDPSTGGWKTITQGTMMAGALDGPIADWDISSLTVDNPTQGPPDNLTNRRVVTLRLRAQVVSMDPKRMGVRGEARRAVHIEHDPDLLPGYPVNLGGSGEMNAKIVDLDGDGKRELVLADAAGLVHAFGPDAKEKAGWPQKVNLHPCVDTMAPAGVENHAAAPVFAKGGLSTDVRSATAFSIAAGDLDGDGKPEVVVGTFDGFVYAFRGDGSLVSGWPFSIDRSTRTKADREHVTYEGIMAAPAMADFNGDARQEVVVATQNALLYVLGGDGKPLSSWNGGQPRVLQDPTLSPTSEPKQLRDRVMSSPALGDLNGDGTPDIVLGTNENYDSNARLYAVDGKSGAFLPGWPRLVVSNYILPMVGSGLPNAPALADFDGDGKVEVIIGGIGSGLRIYRGDGTPYTHGDFGGVFPNAMSTFGANSDARNGTTIVLVANPAVGDLDDDGSPEVLMPTGGGDALVAFSNGGTRRDFEHHVSAWDTRTGAFLPAFPRVIEDWQFFTNPTIADVDGDGRSEVLAGSGGYWVHGWRADGTEAKGFPKLTGGWVTASVAVGDMDGDGKLEYAVTTRNGWLFAWRGGGSAGSDGRIDWGSFHHDNGNTGNWSAPLDQGGKKGVPPPEPEGSCGMAGRGARGGAGLALLLGAVALMARRRRRG